MGNWIPGDPTLVAQILKISSAYSPPPPEGFVSPMTWGVEENVIERFGCGSARGADLLERATRTRSRIRSRRPSFSPIPAYYGPTMNAFEAADGLWQGSGVGGRTRCTIQRAECEPEPRFHVYTRRVLACDGSTVTSVLSKWGSAHLCRSNGLSVSRTNVSTGMKIPLSPTQKNIHRRWQNEVCSAHRVQDWRR